MPSIEPSIKPVHVAVGVILNAAGEVLIAQRSQAQHQGGLWEFPGGKVEAGESIQGALMRELREELGIDVHSSRPLITIPHEYKDKRVLLDVHLVDNFSGEPLGLEGQPVLWVSKCRLAFYEFPAANKPIISAIQLPSLVAISAGFQSRQDFIGCISRAVERGAGMIYIRQSRAQLPEDFLEDVSSHCASLGASVVVKPEVWSGSKARQRLGVHFSAAELMRLHALPEVDSAFIGASCHNLRELEQASELGVDYAFLSPVNKTPSHPDAAILGFDRFADWVSRSKIPVYALGGLAIKDAEHVRQIGGHGVAGITAFWN